MVVWRKPLGLASRGAKAVELPSLEGNNGFIKEEIMTGRVMLTIPRAVSPLAKNLWQA